MNKYNIERDIKQMEDDHEQADTDAVDDYFERQYEESMENAGPLSTKGQDVGCISVSTVMREAQPHHLKQMAQAETDYAIRLAYSALRAAKLGYHQDAANDIESLLAELHLRSTTGRTETT